MGKKIVIEVCLISARGVRRSSLLWKHQWFAVGWIDPDNKYCTKVDASGNANPNWKTKFCTSIDASESKVRDLALHIEVYSREPFFLRERLHGTATVALKEFLAKNLEGSNPEEVGSFQLRKGKSNKLQGFVDVSIRVSEEREEPSSYPPGSGEGFELFKDDNGITLAAEHGASQSHRLQPLFHLRQREANPPKTLPYELFKDDNGINLAAEHRASQSHRPQPFFHLRQREANPPITSLYGAQPMAVNHSNRLLSGRSSSSVGGIDYNRSQTPPPPSNIDYLHNFIPGAAHFSVPNVTSSRAVTARNGGSGLGIGLGAGAVAAGSLIFGEDFMAGVEAATGLRDAWPVVSADPRL